MKLIILKFHIFHIYFTIKQILEVNEKQNKNLKHIRTESFNFTREALKGKEKQLKQRTKGINQRGNVLDSHTTQFLLFKTHLWLINSVQFERVILKYACSSNQVNIYACV